MSPPKEPRIQVDPLDIENKSVEERVQLALAAIACNGFRPNGWPWLSLQEAAKEYGITKGWLTNCFNGKQTKRKAHQHEQVLDFAAEPVLVDWIKEMGRHGVPLHPSTVALHASAILGKTIGKHWVSRFCMRHPELKARWTSGLEKCHAGALNPATVADFYEMLGDITKEYNIPEENIYNMDEKGVQLGVGGRVLALVDQDQKSVKHVEDGNRELVTIIKCVAADGSSIWPSVVFKGVRRNLEWGWDNPCDARYEILSAGNFLS